MAIPHLSEAAIGARQAATDDLSNRNNFALEHAFDQASTGPSVPLRRPGGAAQENENQLLDPRILRPYGEPQLSGGLPRDPIPIPSTARAADPNPLFQQHLVHLDRQAEHATSVENEFSRLNPRDPRQANAVHEAAQSAYLNPDASVHSLTTAYQADLEAEHTAYHRAALLSAARRGSPTERSVNRAVEATQGTQNAAMMATVIREDERTQLSYIRHSNANDYGSSLARQMNNLAGSDLRYEIRREGNGPLTILPRPEYEAALEYQSNSAFSTEHPRAILNRRLNSGPDIRDVMIERDVNGRVVYPSVIVSAAEHSPPSPPSPPPPYS